MNDARRDYGSPPDIETALQWGQMRERREVFSTVLKYLDELAEDKSSFHK